MFKNYLKITWRNLLKNKSFTSINIAGLAVGMASAALILFWVQNEMSYDQFHEKKDRIYQMYNRSFFDGKLICWGTTPKPMMKALKQDYPQVEQAARTNNANYLFTLGDKRLTLTGYHTDADFLTMFSFPLIKGNINTALNSMKNIVITEKTAKKLFGDTEAMGKTIKIDSVDYFTVTGVMKDLPNNTRFSFEYLMPWSYWEKINGREDKNWGNNSVQTYALLKPGITEAYVNSRVKDITRTHSDIKDIDVFMHPQTKWRLYSKFENGKLVGGRITIIRLFSIIAGFILLIACINFMNLSTARSEKRAKEVGIRKVVGASKTSLIVQFLGESIMIALISGVVALILVAVSLPSFNQLTQKQLFIPFGNPFFWLVMVSFILFTGVLSGSYPALFLSSFAPVKVLKGTFKAAQSAFSPRKVLVVTQFTFAIVLIISTIIVKQQLDFAQNRDTGYKKDNLVYTFMSGTVDKNYALIRNELITSGAATSVTKTSAPMTEGWSDTWDYTWDGKQEGAKLDFNMFNVDADFSKTMNLKLVAGRDIDVKAYPSDSTAILLNEAAVKIMGFKDPIGQIVRNSDNGGSKFKVVGVIKDFILQSPYEPVKPMIIQGPKAWFNVIHYKLNPKNTTAENLKLAEDIFKKYNSEYPFDYHFVDDEYSKKFADEKQIGTLATLFAGLTIFISCLGLFGLATYMAQNRIKEIGVRKVLGASVLGVTTMLSKDFLKLVGVSFLVATPLAWYLMHMWLQGYSYRVDISVWVFAIAAFMTTLISIVTVSFQAVKAALTNPVKSLRSE
ncbi:ABC transporter permease [Mucilaginibacter phyllosphaerae]|uniref:Permease n=1 Tax=Mucilaginibacter phyllosphaerae TaxID=1812349 RepID=A0A4Y8A8K4_9SPHI|nr:ABC transporter permease [Mucilaginibacter phyllosphaerae]MBB3970871.1 putative permease [Mucilaginibacter phyllosphaerae]TEW64194.1 FtsX-like permease family protein [Mucilaginibacter phyllosphaerae]GGH05134.1 ABC transporter permease [Mucilaginibacter phyllosphaerae]